MSSSEPGSPRGNRGGASRPGSRAPAVVRVGEDFLDEYPDADPIATELLINLCRAGEALWDVLERQIEKAWGVSQTAFEALAVLDGAGEPLTPTTIGERIIIPSATMTATLDALEKRGWVRRTPNPADRRSLLIEITDEGKAFADEHIPRLHSYERDVMSVFTTAERRQLLEMIVTLIESLDPYVADDYELPPGRRVRPKRLG